MFDVGEGPPVVVIPGLQGRWEWTRPALSALAQTCRTISYSLSGDIGSGCKPHPELGFENYTRQLEDVLDRSGVERAVICGVSYGGFVALRYAARNPDRVSALILASAPGPGWQPSAQQAGWLSKPWLSAPAFVATSPLRVWPEVSAALPHVGSRLAFLARQGVRCLAAPMIPSLMAARVKCAAGIDFDDDCRRIALPTLVVSGEEPLDRVVPVCSTRTYAELIPRADYRVLPQTGHMAILTRPATFAGLVSEFAHAHHH
jgi:pimeloyl-ACP methyl ester carboxylesterase